MLISGFVKLCFVGERQENHNHNFGLLPRVTGPPSNNWFFLETTPLSLWMLDEMKQCFVYDRKEDMFFPDLLFVLYFIFSLSSFYLCLLRTLTVSFSSPFSPIYNFISLFVFIFLIIFINIVLILTSWCKRDYIRGFTRRIFCKQLYWLQCQQIILLLSPH